MTVKEIILFRERIHNLSNKNLSEMLETRMLKIERFGGFGRYIKEVSMIERELAKRARGGINA